MNERNVSLQHGPIELARATQRLRAETELLCALEARGALSRQAPAARIGIDAWLIDRTARPAAVNAAFVAAVNSPAVMPGRAKFHLVLQVGPRAVAGDGITQLARDLQSLWARCQETAQSMGLRVLAIGVLPTIDDADLAPSNLAAATDATDPQRRALCRLDIESAREHLLSEHLGMVAAAATASLHAHLQVAPEAAARFYNAAIIGAAATTGLAASAPYLFGADLWDDTRVALLEPARSTATEDRAALPARFAASPDDYFRANLEQPVAQIAQEEAPPRFAQLRCHNESLWRWVRLQVDFDRDDTAHLRVDQHAMSPGPTPADMVANLCFHYGLTASLATEPDPPELRIAAKTAGANLLAVARGGLGAEVAWLDRERMPLRSLLIVELIERAHEGLHQLGVDDEIARRHLSLIERRVAGGQTAAVWQRRFVHAHGRNFALLVREYAARQLGGAPVHEWNLRRLT